MTIYRQKTRRDANEAAIVTALEMCGVTVTQLSAKGVPDLLCGYQGNTFLIEVKMPKGKLTDDQVKWHDKWRGQVAVVHNVEEALAAIGATVTKKSPTVE